MSKDILINSNQLSNETINYSSILENDLWGLIDFNKELQEVDKLTLKCNKIKKRSNLIISTVGNVIGSSMLVVQFQKWRTNRLKENIINSLEILLPKVAYIEESIRLWLEAIVMKKWNIRNEVILILNNINELKYNYEQSIEIYQNQLLEYKQLIKILTKEIYSIDNKLNFLHVFIILFIYIKFLIYIFFHQDVYIMKEIENDLRLRYKYEIQNNFNDTIDYCEAVPSYGNK